MPDEATQHEVTRETVVPAEREQVWEAVTAPDWLGSDRKLELEPGEGFRATGRDGFVEEVEPERRLVFWWGAPGEESSRVELTLGDHEDGTVVRVVESRPLQLVESWLGSRQGPQMVAGAA